MGAENLGRLLYRPSIYYHPSAAFEAPVHPPRSGPDRPPLTPISFHILLALADGEKHGYGIVKEVEERSDGLIRLGAGTLYTAIRRLETEALIEECAGSTNPEHARRRYYRLTVLGRKVARAEAARLARLLEVARAKAIAPPLRPSMEGRKA